jgi:hypothetical protein
MREIRRMAEELSALTFDRGGHWQVCVGGEGLEDGYTPRSAGAPVYHDLAQEAGTYCSRAEVLAGLDRLIAGCRCRTKWERELWAAAEKVAGLRLKRSYLVSKPMLPPDAGDYYQVGIYPAGEYAEAADAQRLGGKVAGWLRQHGRKPFGDRGVGFIVEAARAAWHAALALPSHELDETQHEKEGEMHVEVA